jgi:hypothetical protein
MKTPPTMKSPSAISVIRRTAMAAPLGEKSLQSRDLTRRVGSSAELSPKAEPKGKAKAALFDSEADFITATRQLIRHKRLV